MTLPARGAALAAGVVLCAALTAACGTDGDAGGGGRQPSGIAVTTTVAPDPTATDLTDLTRILDRAESAAAAAESDGADDD